MRMKFFKHRFIWIIIFIGFITAQELPEDWATYWQEFGQAVISDRTNQWIIGIAALRTAVGLGFALNYSKYASDDYEIGITSQLQLKFTIPL